MADVWRVPSADDDDEDNDNFEDEDDKGEDCEVTPAASMMFKNIAKGTTDPGVDCFDQ